MKVCALIISIFFSLHCFAYEIGDEVHDFTLGGTKNIILNDQKDHKKYIVLEWYNSGCPFVRKHYDSGNIPKLQKKYRDKVIWLTINSSAPGKQGFIKDAAAAKKLYKKEGMSSLALLLDPEGVVGRDFHATATPHFFILDSGGKLVYQGAIDSIASADKADIAHANNYVAMALDEVLAGKKISHPKTTPYGCSVKY